MYGKIQKILPGMQAAFVDIGKSRNAFIHIKDIIPKRSNETGNRDENFDSINIKDYIRVGMKVLVQIQKDKCQSKGAKATTHIKITGRYVILIPNVDFVTVSSKIEDKDEIKRLKDIIEKNKKENFGIIIRTAAIHKKENDILKDLNKLTSKWNEIYNNYNTIEIKNNPIPCLIYKNYNVLEKLILDMLDKNIKKITVNNKKLKENIELVLNENNSNFIKIDVKEDSFFEENVMKDLRKLKERKIWLKCGGFITIDKTEALTAIDVNTGKYIGKNDQEDTIFEVNRQATVEIARQIRLRDIGGIIVIDYIDMNEKCRKNIIEIWSDCIRKDRSKIQIVGFTPLNLLEITRKHMWS